MNKNRKPTLIGFIPKKKRQNLTKETAVNEKSPSGDETKKEQGALMVYADFEYYAETYLGTAIPEENFPRIVKKASQYINHFTFGRITEENMDEFPTLPDCVCDMADVIYGTLDKNGLSKKEKKSENTDGYAVAYVTENVDGKTSESMLQKKLYAIAEVYLMNTGLLYLGID